MTWQVGDLALCVARGSWWEVGSDHIADPQAHPRSGGVYTVQEVDTHAGETYLVFGNFTHAYEARVFKRISPLTDEERREALAEVRVPEVVGA